MLADKGLITDLSGSPWTKLITGPGAAVTDKDGKTYALPVDSTSIGVFHDPRPSRSGAAGSQDVR